ncbi:MAG: serine racemase VanT catalytic subunit [Lachnospiraceae bacterium]|nr:serine racemase VanT catalytic subunit [Lachnospiraceae bacterium]
MKKNTSYTGIDYFRLIAAFLIITIHTSPLSSYNAMENFILTRIIARVAVPFFFMTSGFFLISRYVYRNDNLIKFIKGTASIYAISIFIYLPVNIYNGYFSMENLIPNIIKDLVFDGTFYHLWYLPATILGGGIAWWLVKRLDYKKALTVAALLYLIGLFGDSYYGITEKFSSLNSFYSLIFQISDYTRNGVFFTPVFFVIGGYIADSDHRISLQKSLLGLLISFLLMFLEAITLHYFKLQRHDSMYVFLLPCMYFLFSSIIHFKGKRLVWLRTCSLIIYIIHPMMIVAIRFAAKFLHLQHLLVDNSLVHSFMVCLTSVVFSVLVATLWNKFKPKKTTDTAETDRAYLEINLRNLEHNAKILQQAMVPECKLMAVVKAEAYGHGAFEITSHLNKMGIKDFAVATIDEGIHLRKYGIRGNILILGYTCIQRAPELKKYDLTQTLIDFHYASALNSQGVVVKAHIKIDTGMHRLGIPSSDFSKVEKIFHMKNIKVYGIFTHLCCSDSLLPEDAAFTKKQIKCFYGLIDVLKKDGITIPKLHIQSSYGLLNYPDLNCDYVRAGIALYGVLSSPKDDTLLKLDLRPVLSLKSKIILIRTICTGESVGYGRSFQAQRDSLIAIVPIGYGDGFPRSLSYGKGSVLIHDKYAPIVGRICMDQLAVDVTELDNVSVGDEVTLISGDKFTELSATAVAACSNSISNELLCRMGDRLSVKIT